jgi:peptidoglycan hydrolase-like protein with peptidoglycan-binding domain
MGTVLAVTVALLLMFLVPGGAVADAPGTVSISNGTVAVSPSNITSDKGNAIFVGSAGETYSATAAPTPSPTPVPTPISTTKPDPTENSIDMDDLVEDFVVVADQYYTDYHYSPNHYEYTEGEVYILAQLIHGEARGEIWEGKIAVANVVMNRVLCRGAFPDTIKGVVTDPDQFSGYKPTIKPSRECIRAAREVLENELWVIPQDVYYFRSGAPANVNWGRLPFYKKIDGHCFYRQKLRGRMQGGGVPPAMFERVYKYAQLGCKPEDRVYRIQFMLDALGYDIEKVDSRFGDDTEKALIKFQQDHGLEDDGMAGPTTVRKLIEEYGTRDYFVKFCI